ncbi:MAG: hypothetical protein BIFFINMI_02493 [Phycisphaerae bacterium]|nr:hypothetical protein [Phycisphaerae bacterium]
MTRHIALALLIALGLPLAAAVAADAPPTTQPEAAARHVDLAICLDTSGSMDGLIDAARAKLWDIVNTLAAARPRPILRVAVYEYGNDGLKRETGWVRQVVPLTDDLDTVYKELFALRTNGGTEYVARVVTAATDGLKWSDDKRALRIIYVAGNEPATQDPEIKAVDAAKKAITAGIIVNTIHCGDVNTGINTGWQAVAQAGEGKYASIDQNQTFAVATPYDKELGELNAKLNTTYVAYGAEGQAGQANQVAQDANAAKLGAPAAAQRAAAKGSVLYNNARWDLVDASKQKDFDLSKVKDEDLPEEMRKMSLEERKAYVEKMAAERAAIQDKIKDLAAKQAAFIDKARKEQSATAATSFDTVLLKSLTEQAEAKGFTFEKPQEQPKEQPAPQKGGN